MPEPGKERTPAQEGEPVYEDIGLDQGFGGRMLEKKSIKDELMGLFAAGPGGMMTADELAGIGGAAAQTPQAMQTPAVPGMAATGTGGFNGLPQVKQFGNTAAVQPQTPAESGDLMEQKCKVITDPTVCKQTLGCFYNFPKKVCHKDVKV